MGAERTAPRVLAAIISYNRKEKLANAVEGVLRQEGASCDVMVIDNASEDGAQDLVRKRFADRGVELCDLPCNVGCAGGMYRAGREGVLRGYDRVWIMDDDTVPGPTALAELIAADVSLAGSFGFLSSAAYWRDGSLCKANVQKTGLFTFVGPKDYDDGPVRIKMASICSLYLSCIAVREVRLPIAEYFFYTEDYEFTSRLAREFPCYLVPASKVCHDMVVNAKADIACDTKDRMWRYGYLYRNDVHCYRALGGGWLYLAAKAGYATVRILTVGRVDRVKKLLTLWSALREGLRFSPEIYRVLEWGDVAYELDVHAPSHEGM